MRATNSARQKLVKSLLLTQLGMIMIALFIPFTCLADDSFEVAGKASARFINVLRQKITETVAEKGATVAINDCGLVAREILQRIGRETSTELKWTSMRVRNPLNAPTYEELEMLRILDKLQRTQKLPDEIVLRQGEKITLARPIIMQASCLACHGAKENLSADVRRVLSAKYPRDEAIGYRTGDLRGMVSATFSH